MQTPKKFSSFSDQVSWISDEKGIKIKDREYAEEMLRQIGYFPLMGEYKHLFRISNTKKYKAGTSFEEIVSLCKFDAELRELFFKYLLQIERQFQYKGDIKLDYPSTGKIFFNMYEFDL